MYFQSLFSYKSIEDNFRVLIDSISCNNEILFNDCLMSVERGEVEIRSLSLLINCLVQVVVWRAPLVCQFQPRPDLKIFSLNKAVFTTSITYKVRVLFYTSIDTERKPHSNKQEHFLFSNKSWLKVSKSQFSMLNSPQKRKLGWFCELKFISSSLGVTNTRPFGGQMLSKLS